MELYQESLNTYRDIHNVTETARIEGKIEGKIETQEEVAIALMQEGATDEFIVKITKLPLSEVQRIRKENNF